MKNIDVESVEITEKDIKEAQKLPSDFGLSSTHEKFEEIWYDHTWSLGVIIRHRDSNLLEESNADCLIKLLEEDKSIENDWMITSCNSWLVGWVDHLSFKIFEEDGKTPSKVFKVLKSWFDALSDYPIADESDYSEKEYNATYENIESAGRRFLIDNPPEDWASQCYRWFSDNMPKAIESSDGNGGYPSDDEMKDALYALDFLHEDYLDKEEEESEEEV